MKISQEERERIQKLYNLNEQYDSFDNVGSDDVMDVGRDVEIENMFFNCLNDIKDMFGQNPNKNVYIELIDKYFSDNM